MEDIPKPKTNVQYPDRFAHCQEAIEAAFARLAEHAVMAGWGEEEVAAALVDLADCHMLALFSNMETDNLIRDAVSRFRKR